MKTKLKTNIVSRFDNESILSTILGLRQKWDDKPNSDCISQNKTKITTKDEIHLKCDYINGSIINSIRQPNLNSFASDKHLVFEIISVPETIHHKKFNKFALNDITLHLEDDDRKIVYFNGETLTFTQLRKK